MASNALKPGQSKMDASIDKNDLGKISVTYKTRTSVADKPHPKTGMAGIDTGIVARYINAMIDAAKLVDAEIHAERNEDAKLILTPLFVKGAGKIVEKRLMLNDEEFVPIGVRDATPEEENDENLERWE